MPLRHFAVLTASYPTQTATARDRLVRDCVERMRGRGHLVRVLASEGADVEAGEGVLTRATPEPRGSGRPAAVRVDEHNRLVTREFLRSPRPDVVFCFGLRGIGVEPLREAQRRGLAVVLVVNDAWPLAPLGSRPRTPWRSGGSILESLGATPRAWRGAEVRHVVYGSEGLSRYLREAGAPLPPGPYAGACVDTRVFRPRAFRPLVSPSALLYAGPLAHGGALALDTLRALNARGHDTRLTLVDDGDAPAASRLRDAIARQGLGPRVAWQTRRNPAHTAALYHAADLVLAPAGWQDPEGWEVLEALACGCPVVGSGRASARLRGCDVVSVAARGGGAAVADEIASLAGDPHRQRSVYERGVAFTEIDASLDGYVDTLIAAADATHIASSARATLVPSFARRDLLPTIPPPTP